VAFDELAGQAIALDTRFGANTLDSLKDPRWVVGIPSGGVDRTLPNLANDRDLLQGLSTDYRAYTIERFNQVQPRPGVLAAFIGARQAPPSEQLRDLLRNYGLDASELIEGNRETQVQLLLDRVRVPIDKAATTNAGRLALYQKIRQTPLLPTTTSFDGVPFELRLALVEPLTNAYDATVADLRLPNVPVTLYGKADGVLEPSTALDAVEGRLRTAVSQELGKLDQRVQGAIFGIPISLPVIPVLAAIPLVCPIYAIWLGQLYRKAAWHRRAVMLLDDALAGSALERLAPLVEPDGSGFGWRGHLSGALQRSGTIPTAAAAAAMAGMYTYVLIGARPILGTAVASSTMARWMTLLVVVLYGSLALVLHVGAVLILVASNRHRIRGERLALKAS